MAAASTDKRQNRRQSPDSQRGPRLVVRRSAVSGRIYRTGRLTALLSAEAKARAKRAAISASLSASPENGLITWASDRARRFAAHRERITPEGPTDSGMTRSAWNATINLTRPSSEVAISDVLVRPAITRGTHLGGLPLVKHVGPEAACARVCVRARWDRPYSSSDTEAVRQRTGGGTRCMQAAQRGLPSASGPRGAQGCDVPGLRGARKKTSRTAKGLQGCCSQVPPRGRPARGPTPT